MVKVPNDFNLEINHRFPTSYFIWTKLVFSFKRQNSQTLEYLSFESCIHFGLSLADLKEYVVGLLMFEDNTDIKIQEVYLNISNRQFEWISCQPRSIPGNIILTHFSIEDIAHGLETEVNRAERLKSLFQNPVFWFLVGGALFCLLNFIF